MNIKVIAAACIALTLNACASHPSSVKAAYVSPTTYQHLKCDQVAEEQRRLESEVERVTKEQRSAANTDAAVMGIGLVLFWPALFALAIDSDHSEELAKLKGELQAAQEASAQCRVAAAAEPAAVPGAAASAPTAAAPAAPGSRPALPDIPQGMCRMGGQYVPC